MWSTPEYPSVLGLYSLKRALKPCLLFSIRGTLERVALAYRQVNFSKQNLDSLHFSNEAPGFPTLVVEAHFLASPDRTSGTLAHPLRSGFSLTMDINYK